MSYRRVEVDCFSPHPPRQEVFPHHPDGRLARPGPTWRVHRHPHLRSVQDLVDRLLTLHNLDAVLAVPRRERVSPHLGVRAPMKSNLSVPLPACQATSSAIVGVGVLPLWVTVQSTWERAEAEPQRICHIISMPECLRDRRSSSGSLWLSLSAQSHQSVVPTQYARIARAGQRQQCHIIDLSECLRV